MEELLLVLVAKYPVLLSVFLIVGGLRSVFKPVMVLVEKYVVQSENKDDDAKLAKLKASSVYQGFVFALDYAASIKLPK